MTAEVPAVEIPEAVQKAAAPVAFIAILIGACLAVTAIIRRYGSSLPPAEYNVEYAPATRDDDEDQDDDDEEPSREQWS